jgi:NAD(P)-dependent dehydrogenase (short-subunit alcohol dehydrogenase family)
MSLAMLKAKWSPPRDPTTSFAGKNVIVTGANTGIGFETAVKYSALGASKVILGVRSVQKGQTAKSKIEERTQRTGTVEVWELDMGSYDSIKKFAARASGELGHLDVVVLNAGVTVPEYHQSQYAWEETLQVNTLSTSLLALLLVPKLRGLKSATSAPILEIVGSERHQTASIPASHRAAILKSFNTEATYNVHVNYDISKLLVMYTVRTLAKMTAKNTGEPEVIITACCPGATKSDLARGFDAW